MHMCLVGGPQTYDLPSWQSYRAEWMSKPENTPGRDEVIAECDRVIAALTGPTMRVEEAAAQLRALAAEILAERQSR